MVGKLLGDGSITKQAGRKSRFQFMHRVADFEWTQYCYEQLQDYIPLNPPMYKRIVDSRLKAGFSESYFVQSRTHNLITELEALWYKNRKKQLPFDFIYRHLNEEALAWWYQDDGHLKLENGIARKIILSTENFSEEENKKLKGLLKSKFHLTFSLDGQNRLILYDQFQILYFLRLVEPFMHFSMKRKQIVKTLANRLAKTTTIYLPATFQITRPTYDINDQLCKLNILFEFVKDRDGHLRFFKEHHWINGKNVTKSYRIIIAENHKTQLSRIRSITGLSNSKIIECCFRS